MSIQHRPDALALISDVLWRMPSQKCQDAHCFQYAKHLIIWAQRPCMCEDTIVGSL